MKKVRNLVIGGIESKVVNLILVSILLIAAVFLASMLTQGSMLAHLTRETNEKQLSAMTGTTTVVVDTVIEQHLDRITDLEAGETNEIFRDLSIRVRMLSEYARKLLNDPDSVPRAPWARPDAAHDGELFVKALFAEGVEVSSVEDRLGVIANLSGMMKSVCGAYEADNIWFTLPEGVTLMADTISSNWVHEDGSYVSYDAVNRYWYRQAVEEGKLIFTDVETDHRTGELCVTCAMPVYGSDGTLLGVAGADLYLKDLRETIAASAENGGFLVVINQKGHVILSPMEQGIFRAVNSADAVDLRQSDNEALAALIREGMQGKTDVRLVPLPDGRYYMICVPMKTVGWMLIAAYSEEEAGKPVQRIQADYQEILQEAASVYYSKSSQGRTQMWVILSILLILLLTGAVILGKRIVKPLNTITRRISELSEGNLEFKMEDAYRTGDEVEELAKSFATVSHKTVEYLDTVKRVTAEKERIGVELSLANQIQAAMLPHMVPAFPDRRDFDILGRMDPAKEVGGDFYDYFLIDEDHLGMVMADVSGKGVPAALFMMVSKIIIQSVAMLGRTPAEILQKTNEALCSNNEAEMFVTAWVGILELSTGKLSAANAGHEYPLFREPDGRFEVYKDPHGFVIGGLEEAQYSEYEIQMRPGSKLFVYTDGVPEATNDCQEMFGMERLADALNSQPDLAPIDMLTNVRSEVDRFVKDAEQFDDLTMMCLEYKGPENNRPA